MAIKRIHNKVAGTVRTTDGTTTTVATMPIPTDYAGFIKGYVTGRDASNGAEAGCANEVGAGVDNVSGTVTVRNQKSIYVPDLIGSTIALTASGTNVVLTVDNVSGTATIDWYGELELWATAP